MIALQQGMTSEVRPKMRGGEGAATLNFFDMPLPNNVRLLAQIALEPGSSIGFHRHENETELFYMLEGEFEVDDDGTARTMRPGDCLSTGSGAGHSVKNASTLPGKMLAVIISA